jgi:serine/threonine-protein kinase
MTDDSAIPPGSDGAPLRYNANDIIAGKYKLLSVMGEGGMGEVWEARNIALDSPVAIKLIRADLNEDSAGERLVQEARAAARLGHPAIVRVFDVGETKYSDPFIVMELLRGDNLGDLLGAEGRLPAVAAVQILLPIADALATAHLKGIVHRDIKPDNIYLAEDVNGELQPKLVDFGVAKLEYAEVDSKLTMKGTIVGSPGYLAPEQARGSDSADYRVDVWAFSVVLYELVTGLPPFNGGNYNALLRSIVEDDPVPTTQHAAGDTALWQILERGLRKSAEERWPSMLEYGRALAHWAFSQGVDEDVCGTGLEAKWLSGKVSGARGSLVSVNFEDSETPSAIRQRRRARSEAPQQVGLDTIGPTLTPPPPSLPSPRNELAGASVDGAKAFANTELDSSRPAPRENKRLWIPVAVGVAFLGMGAALLLLLGSNTSQSSEPALAAPPPPTVAQTHPQIDSNAAVAESVKLTEPVQPAAETKPEVEISTDASEVPKSPEGKKPGAVRRAAQRTVPPAAGVASGNTPAKKAQKALTQKPETPKLDLKKPY